MTVMQQGDVHGRLRKQQCVIGSVPVCEACTHQDASQEFLNLPEEEKKTSALCLASGRHLEF